MADKKLCGLLKLRRVLIVLAAGLFCLTAVSGLLYITGGPADFPDAAETTAPIGEESEPTEDTGMPETDSTATETLPTEDSPFKENPDRTESSGVPSGVPNGDPGNRNDDENSENIGENEGSSGVIVDDNNEDKKSDVGDGNSAGDGGNSAESGGNSTGNDGNSTGSDGNSTGSDGNSTGSDGNSAGDGGNSAESGGNKAADSGNDGGGTAVINTERGTSDTVSRVLLIDAGDGGEITMTMEATLSETTFSPESVPEEAPQTNGRKDLWGLISWISLNLLAADLLAITVISIRIGHLSRTTAERAPVIQKRRRAVQIGKVHQIGARSYQQDSLGYTEILNGGGTFAVVADGMGGLSNSDQVSQQIVMEMLTLSQQIKADQTQNALNRILTQVNDDINETLGREGLYKSGSTVVAVMVTGMRFQWISVGDSRIYLYREGYVNQLNQDHDQLQLWMKDVLAGTMPYEEAARNPEGRKLTSFIGMGELRFVDASLSDIDLLPGDRIVLMSDGVYGVLNEDQLSDILKMHPNVKDAAAVMDARIKDAHNPHQDNYSALILGY